MRRKIPGNVSRNRRYGTMSGLEIRGAAETLENGGLLKLRGGKDKEGSLRGRVQAEEGGD